MNIRGQQQQYDQTEESIRIVAEGSSPPASSRTSTTSSCYCTRHRGVDRLLSRRDGHGTRAERGAAGCPVRVARWAGGRRIFARHNLLLPLLCGGWYTAMGSVKAKKNKPHLWRAEDRPACEREGELLGWGPVTVACESPQEAKYHKLIFADVRRSSSISAENKCSVVLVRKQTKQKHADLRSDTPLA